MKKTKVRTSKSLKIEEESEKEGQGKFNFPNGDSYEGGYIVVNNKEVYRHGYGIYRTSDQDEYRAVWDKDRISSNFHVVYSNKAEYKGELDEEGKMSGKGTYVFPDATALSALWEDNQPIFNCVYKDPLGYKWQGKLSIDNQEVIFAPENRIWDEQFD